MIFSIAIKGAPYSTQAPESALRFAQAVLKEEHQIFRVFFYHDAVHCASTLSVAPQDENNIPQQWQQFAQQHNLDIVICVTAALKRGVIDSREAQRYEKATHNIEENMALSGLGQLVEAAVKSDRLITFGC